MTVTEVERVFFGGASRAQVTAWVGDLVAERLGASVEETLFRSGRIDAVYGLRLSDGRSVVLKLHRPPVDGADLLATNEVLGYLYRRGYPCPEPVDGPLEVDGRVVSIQSLLHAGEARDGRVPEVLRAMAASQAQHIELLRDLPGADSVAARLGRRPAWTAYAEGPWPVPHDAVFDFTVTPPGGEWLDQFAREAADDIARWKGAEPPVMGHGDWYVGNLRFRDGVVVATFDWDVIVDHEAVIVGLFAGGYLEDAPAPEDIDAYLTAYEEVRPRLRARRPLAVAAARWMLAFNARCDLAFSSGEPQPGSALHVLRTRREDLLALA